VKAVCVRLPEPLIRRLDELAKQMKTSRNELIRQALYLFVLREAGR